MTVSGETAKTSIVTRRPDERTLELDAFLGANKASVSVNLDPEHPEHKPLIEIQYSPTDGEVEDLTVI